MMTPAPLKNLPPSTDVIVVGGGPAGLATALSLRVQGVNVIVVDGATGPGIGSRAAVVHAASLEELNTLGLASKLIGEGIPATEFSFRDDENKPLMNIDFSILKDVTDFPMILLIAQDVVERVMVERLAELGVRTIFNKTVIRMREIAGGEGSDSGRLACTFASGETVIARTVVGADGSRSLVRQVAGIRFYDPHTKLEPIPSKDVIQLVLADILVSGPLPPTFVTDRPLTTFGSDGMVMLYPLKSPPDCPRGTYFFRFVCSLTPDDPEPPSVPSVQYIQNLLDARGPGSRLGKAMPRVVQVLTGSRYRTRSAIAEDFCSLPPRHGRAGAIALVGDAAHIHSPSGGQGMNLSICDGVRLGRALAVGTRYALSAYARDRRAAAQRGIELSERLMEFANVRGSWALGIRNAAMRTMMKFQGKQRSFALRMSGLTDPNDLWTW